MKKLISILFGVLLPVALIAQAPIVRGDFTTNAFNALTYGVKFVDSSNGSDSYVGSAGRPYASLTYAQTNVSPGGIIYVMPGLYTGQITRGGVLYQFSRGAILTNSTSTIYTDATNIIIRGEGDFRSADRGIYVMDSGLVDIQARYISGGVAAIEISTGTGKSTVRVRGGHVSGALLGESFDQDPEFWLMGCTYIGTDAAVVVPYTVAGCISTADAANANRTGSWTVNASLVAP